MLFIQVCKTLHVKLLTNSNIPMVSGNTRGYNVRDIFMSTISSKMQTWQKALLTKRKKWLMVFT